MASAANPYVTPAANLGTGTSASGEAVALRQEYLKHEANVRSIGVLYFLSAFMMAFGAVGILIAGLQGDKDTDTMIGAAVGLAVLASLFFWLGKEIRKLNPAARIPAGILAFIGLLNPPFGTLINGWILYLLLGPKGRVVFSEEYRLAVEQTPHIQHKTSMVVKVLGILLLVGLGLAFVGLLIS